MPAVAIVMGEIISVFNPLATGKEINDQMGMLAVYIIICGAVSFLFNYIFYAFFQHLAENISFSLRSRFLKALLM